MREVADLPDRRRTTRDPAAPGCRPRGAGKTAARTRGRGGQGGQCPVEPCSACRCQPPVSCAQGHPGARAARSGVAGAQQRWSGVPTHRQRTAGPGDQYRGPNRLAAGDLSTHGPGARSRQGLPGGRPQTRLLPCDRQATVRPAHRHRRGLRHGGFHPSGDRLVRGGGLGRRQPGRGRTRMAHRHARRKPGDLRRQ
ncbi:hypothetical protein D3C75_588440 [compost metagenome]